jgi:hypothetical protein
MNATVRKLLSFEALERKQMLAGDVVVSLIDGNLFVAGDLADNQIVVTAGETAGSLVIQGLEGTVVKRGLAGQPAPATGLVVEGVRGNVTVNMGAGDDTVAFHDVELPRGLVVNGGLGADVVRVGAAEDADPPGADDSLDDPNVAVRGSLLVRTGAGDDTVVVGSVRTGGVLGISTDGGNDSVSLGAAEGDATADDAPATLRAGLGVDVALGDGDDDLVARDVAARGVLGVGGGRGADDIDLVDVRTAFLGVAGGFGEAGDLISLTDVHAEHAGIQLGDGADEVEIVDSAFSSLGVALGAGDDTLTLTGTTAKRALLAGGGGEADEYVDGGGNELARVLITGFEIPADVNTELPDRPTKSGPFGGLPRLLANRFRR